MLNNPWMKVNSLKKVKNLKALTTLLVICLKYVNLFQKMKRKETRL